MAPAAGPRHHQGRPRLTHPSNATDLIGRLTTQLVPPGEATRAYFAPAVPLNTPEDASLIVKVIYSDASSADTVWTKATVQQRNRSWRVVQVQIGAGDKEEPMVTSAAAV